MSNDYSEYFLHDYGRRNGTIQYPNGDIYTGELQKIKEEDDDGDKPYNGIMRYANGDVYEGEWGSEFSKEGNGIMRYANGDVFEGEWQGCMYKGVMRYANGDVYDGEWSRINEDYNIRGDPTDMEFQLSLDTKYGNGIMRYVNGDVYDGEWRFDKKDGYGIMTYANGDVYDGEWANNYKEGGGFMTYANGEVSRGEWRNNEYVEYVEPIEEYEGIAFEVHNKFNKHFQKNSKKYFEIIESCPSVKEDNHYLIHPNIIDHVKNKIDAYIDKHYVQQEKEPLIEKLHAIFERVKNTDYMTIAENKILIGKTIDFVLEQEEDFIKFYLSAFSNDCYHAYSGQGGMSCVKGIIERFYLLIGDTAFALCPDTCENKTYEKLKKLFNKKIDRNELTQEWANTYLESDEIKDLSVENRKKHYISFMVEKYKEADLYDETVKEEIQKEADAFEYAFESLAFGGGKKRKQKKRRTIKKNKKQKTKKSKFGKRKTKTRRNNRKSVRRTKK